MNNLIVFSYQPEVLESEGGRTLLRRADIHIGTRVNSIWRTAVLPSAVTSIPSMLIKRDKRQVTWFSKWHPMITDDAADSDTFLVLSCFFFFCPSFVFFLLLFYSLSVSTNFQKINPWSLLYSFVGVLGCDQVCAIPSGLVSLTTICCCHCYLWPVVCQGSKMFLMLLCVFFFFFTSEFSRDKSLNVVAKMHAQCLKQGNLQPCMPCRILCDWILLLQKKASFLPSIHGRNEQRPMDVQYVHWTQKATSRQIEILPQEVWDVLVSRHQRWILWRGRNLFW